MRNITVFLNKVDLKPKERVLLWVHNMVNKDKTGEDILTKADKHALVEGWKPKDSREANEYNKYNKGANLEGDVRLDTQSIYLRTQNSILRASRVVDHAMYRDHKNGGMEILYKMNLEVDEGEALALILINSGFVFDDLIYELAFQSASEDLKQDILALCPDAETESQYLDQEEIIADLFNGKEYLNSEAKEKLADLILDEIYNKYTKILTEKGLRPELWWFSGYFAELPTLEIAKKWADDNGISYETESKELEKELAEKIHEYSEKNKIEVRDLLKRTILKWLDEGLFIKEYTPICNSDGTATCNDASTKLPHNEVLKKWLGAKAEARKVVQKLIDSGQLEVEIREKDFLGVKETVKIVTGESLYSLDGGFSFAEDFKKQINNLKLLGRLIIFLRNRDFLTGYASLLAFADIYKRLSRIYEIDLGYKIAGFIDDFKNSIEQLNNELRYVADKLEESIYIENGIKFRAEIFVDNMLFHLEEIQPGTGETETHYFNEFEKILGDEF